MRANKTQICKKYIQEADKIIDLMNAIKLYCNQVIQQEEEEDCGGYRGDGCNDPENRPAMGCRRKLEINILDVICRNILIPAESAAVNNTDLMPVDKLGYNMIQVLKQHDQIDFPEEIFRGIDGGSNEPCRKARDIEFDNVRIVEVSSLEELIRLLANQ